MATRLTVSTQCPTCGADLDFGEGSNTVQCRFCHSNLLVTGRKHVLSYSIAPKLNKHRAVAKVLLAHKERGSACRVTNPRLFFVPYYRLTGQDLRWERSMVERDQANADARHALLAALGTETTRSWSVERTDGLGSLLSLVSGVVGDLMAGSSIGEKSGSPAAQPDTATPPPERTSAALAALMAAGGERRGGINGDAEEEIAFRDRYVEKNFVAADLSGTRLYSLGVRPNVLRLNLYHQQELNALGLVTAATISPAVALERALMTAAPQPLVFRGVLGRVLSLIYFPYWVVETERSGKRSVSIVDAVSETVLTLDAPAALLQTLETTEASATTHGVGFRPLVCPNCGWDLPSRPDDVIFVCGSCTRAWQIYRDLLYEVSYQVAEAPASKGAAPSTYLPFWRLRVAVGEDEPGHLTVPAFRYRRLKVLKDLAAALSRVAPAITPRIESGPVLENCYYDQEDAVLLAQVTYIALSAQPEQAAKDCQDRRFRVQDIVLTWLPFEQRGASLVAPFTGQAISRHLLL